MKNLQKMGGIAALIGAACILSVVLASLGLSAVYGLGLIIWFVWLGIVILRRSPVSAAQKPATEQQPFRLQGSTAGKSIGEGGSHLTQYSDFKKYSWKIRIEGELGQEWADWFGGPAISRGGESVTLLTCAAADQAALYGLLRKLTDPGLPLLSINRIDDEGGRE